jgi:hypothetical protein
MRTLTVPNPDELQRRIESCEAELKALRKLQRLADAAQQAEDARQRREDPPTDAEGRTDE